MPGDGTNTSITLTPRTKRRGTFVVEVSGSCELTVEDVWPDGAGPENPTAADVAAALRDSYNNYREVILNLGLPLRVDVEGNIVYEQKGFAGYE